MYLLTGPPRAKQKGDDMKILNRDKLDKVKELLEEAMEIIDGVIKINDLELGGDKDIYDQIRNVVNNIDDF